MQVENLLGYPMRLELRGVGRVPDDLVSFAECGPQFFGLRALLWAITAFAASRIVCVER